MRLDAKAEVAQDLRPQAVTQADVLEPDHVPLRGAAAPRAPDSPQSGPYTATATALESGYLLAISMALRSPFSARPLFAATLLRHLGARAAPPPMVSVALTKGLLACGGKAPIGHDSPMLITCTNCATSYQV